MLSSLHIENIAVVRKLDVEFGGGLTVLTGETGAGKSIIVDSIGLIMGAKPNPQLIRTGETEAYVAALFTEISDTAARRLAECGVGLEDGEVYIERIITNGGKSKAKVNGRSVSASLLRRVAELLITINGQNECMLLRSHEAQLALLDVYAGTGEVATAYGDAYSKLISLRSRAEELRRAVKEGALAADLLKYQINEIDAANLRVGEEEELLKERARLRDREKTVKLANFVYRAAYMNDKGVSASVLAERIATALSQLAKYSDEAAADAERVSAIAVELEEIARRTYANFDLDGADDEDPTERLDRIEGRLDLISRLRRKYGGDIESVLAHRASAAEHLNAIENNEELVAQIEAEIKTAKEKAKSLAASLTALRTDAARSMADRITEILASLDMPKVSFHIALMPRELSPHGAEDVEFRISANAGEDIRPLSLVASGGELSRVMLAVKSVVSDDDSGITVIYDEIDAGVSGATSGKIGLQLRKTAQGGQTICVTHSAQIAAMADTHLLVSKIERDGRAETKVTPLSGEARVNEVARIIGGINVTETQRKAAVDLLAEGARITK